jgi:hypothetical protein
MMPLTNMEHDKAARYASLRRRHPDPEAIAERNETLQGFDDWGGDCGFCKRKLKGTPAELAAHSCPEYEASLG